MVLDLRLTKIGCRETINFFLYLPQRHLSLHKYPPLTRSGQMPSPGDTPVVSFCSRYHMLQEDAVPPCRPPVYPGTCTSSHRPTHPIKKEGDPKVKDFKGSSSYNIQGVSQLSPSSLVRTTGLEPTRRKTLDPKSSAATNYATSANDGTNIQEVYLLYNESGYKVYPQQGCTAPHAPPVAI